MSSETSLLSRNCAAERGQARFVRDDGRGFGIAITFTAQRQPADGDMQDGAGEVAGEKEVAAAAHDEDGLRKSVEVKRRKVFFGRYLYIKGTPHLHAEGVACGQVVASILLHKGKDRKKAETNVAGGFKLCSPATQIISWARKTSPVRSLSSHLRQIGRPLATKEASTCDAGNAKRLFRLHVQGDLEFVQLHLVDG